MEICNTILGKDIVKIEIWGLGEHQHESADSNKYITLEENIKPRTSVLDLVNKIAERYDFIGELVFDRRNQRFYSHVVVMLNHRVINASDLFRRVPQGGDKITILLFVFGG